MRPAEKVMQPVLITPAPETVKPVIEKVPFVRPIDGVIKLELLNVSKLKRNEKSKKSFLVTIHAFVTVTTDGGQKWRSTTMDKPCCNEWEWKD